jgi:hypothetical protein
MNAPALITIMLLATGSVMKAVEETRQPADFSPPTGKIGQVTRLFDGVWKLDVDKNRITGETYTIEQTGRGTFRFDMHGFAYDFDLSGKEFPMPDGDTVSVESPERDRFTFTVRRNGETVRATKLSVEGNKGQWQDERRLPEGEVLKSTVDVQRVSGGPGFLGKWQTTEVKGGLVLLELTTAPPDRITLKFPEARIDCQGRFDGKPYPVLLEGSAANRTSSFEKLGEFSFKVMNSLQGKPMHIDVFTLSQDGQTLTIDSKPVAADEPTQVIFRRQ